MTTDSITGVDSLERYIEAIRDVWGDGTDPGLAHKVTAIMRGMLLSADLNRVKRAYYDLEKNAVVRGAGGRV